MRSVCSPALVRLALPFLFCSAFGCASDKDHLEKQLTKLNDEVRHLQSETDRMGERLDAVETRTAAAPHYAEERVAANATTLTRPKLKIVRVEPGDAAPDETTEETQAPVPEADTGPRVVIQGEGKSIESRTLPAAAPVAAKTTKPDGAKSGKAEAASSK